MLYGELDTNPWWRPDGERGAGDVRVRIVMRGVRASNIALGWRQSEVEELVVLTDDPRLWVYGTHATIFGNSPLPDPKRLFLEYWDLVHVTLHAEAAADIGDKFVPFTTWAARVSGNRSYELLDGPLPLMEACRPLLDAQGVDYVVLKGPERQPDDLRVVWIGESWVVCDEATIDLPSEAV